jgi:uncharacterized low-complexity protein
MSPRLRLRVLSSLLGAASLAATAGYAVAQVVHPTPEEFCAGHGAILSVKGEPGGKYEIKCTDGSTYKNDGKAGKIEIKIKIGG